MSKSITAPEMHLSNISEYDRFSASKTKLGCILEDCIKKLQDAATTVYADSAIAPAVEVPTHFRCFKCGRLDETDLQLPQILLVASGNIFVPVEVAEVFRSGIATRKSVRGKGTKVLTGQAVPKGY